MTTSRLCSTRRLAFSMTISATCTWRAAGSSKVELMTSPLTERCMSVTSSGRSSISRTISTTSGWLVVMRVGDGLQQHGLAGARRSDDQAALALADGRQQVHDAAGDVLAHGLHLDALLRIERRQVVEEDLVAGLFGRLEVDGFDLDQGEVLLAFVRRAHVAGDGVAGLEVELADLRGRDVDVVRAGQVVVVGRAQEAVAVGQDFEHAFGEDVAFFFALGLKNLEDEVLLAEAAGAGDVEAAGKFAQFGNVVFFQFGDCHGLPEFGIRRRDLRRGKARSA